MPRGEAGVSLVRLRDLPLAVNHISNCPHQGISRIEQSCNQ